MGLPQSMKALALRKYKEAPRIVTRPLPRLAKGDVLVQVCAAGINPLDKMLQDGSFRFLLPYKRPFVLGHDLAGVVVDKGAGATKFNVGDQVFSRARDLRIGSFAEFIAVHEDDVAQKPSNLSMEEAASVPLVALAAWQILTEVVAIRPGERILIHAGAGGLGSCLIQLAAELGAHVSTTVRTPDLERVRALGASQAFDFTKEKFWQHGERYDAIVDSVGGATYCIPSRCSARTARS